MGRERVKPKDLPKAKDKDLIASLAAIRRAAAMARMQAVRTGTAIVVNREHRLVRVEAEELSREDRG